MKYKIRNILLFLFFSFLQIVCLEDSIKPPVIVDITSTAELLIYLESKGDYFNSDEMPSIIHAPEVFANIDNYLIIDIRERSEFTAGHIQGAINVSHDKIIDLLDTLNTAMDQQIVIVSTTGQSAAYYNSYLRLLGYANSFSLGFGMASWNGDFADPWFNACMDALGLTGNFTDVEIPKNGFSDLPVIEFSGPEFTIEEKAKKRIISLMKQPFHEFVTESLFKSDYYIVCFAEKTLYYSKLYGTLHPQNAVHYSPPPDNPDLRSVSSLQTLPNDKTILLYSYTGQLSAYAAAYLKLLGYDAKSFLFGANGFYYNIMLSIPDFEQYNFTFSKVKNYPYVSGE